jgi:hypothetical protein
MKLLSSDILNSRLYMSIEIISDALKYFDMNNDKYRRIKRRIKYVKRFPDDKQDIEGLKLIFYDNNMEELFVSRLEILGKYYNSINTWVWGWSLPPINKSLTTIIRKVFLYGTDIDINNNPANIMLKNELVTSRFRTYDDVQLDIHCSIASYLAKKPFILALKDFSFNYDLPNEVKSEDYEGTVDITYYMYVIDPPNIEK